MLFDRRSTPISHRRLPFDATAQCLSELRRRAGRIADALLTKEQYLNTVRDLVGE
ncbi:MAG TPA: hypothetical protein VH374_16725 [Polyangia bacterium]|nr:hypothetical protein [Polyangia bacterium]